MLTFSLGFDLLTTLLATKAATRTATRRSVLLRLVVRIDLELLVWSKSTQTPLVFQGFWQVKKIWTAKGSGESSSVSIKSPCSLLPKVINLWLFPVELENTAGRGGPRWSSDMNQLKRGDWRLFRDPTTARFTLWRYPE